MKKLHKLLAALLAVLILLSLAACGKNADESAPTKADTSGSIGSILAIWDLSISGSAGVTSPTTNSSSELSPVMTTVRVMDELRSE